MLDERGVIDSSMELATAMSISHENLDKFLKSLVVDDYVSL